MVTISRRSLAFAVAYSSLLAFAFVFQSLPPVLRHIFQELNIDHAQGGLLMGIFALPGIFIAIPSGWLADRYGFRKVGVIAVFMMILGTVIVAIGDDFLMLAIGRFVSGIGAMTLVVIAASLLSTTFRGPKLGIAMGFYNTGMPLGTILAFNTLGVIATSYGWRVTMVIPIIVSLIALALMFLWHDDETSGQTTGIFETLSSMGGSIWLLGLVWLWFNAAAIAFLTFSPDYFSSLKYSAPMATFLASSIMWGALIVSPAIGPFLTNISRKKALVIGGSILPALIFFGIPAAPLWLIPLVIALGLTASLLPPPLFALPAEIVKNEQQGIAFGVLSTCLNIGVLLGPFMVGFSRDQTGTYDQGFLIMGVFSLLAALSIAPLSRYRKSS